MLDPRMHAVETYLEEVSGCNLGHGQTLAPRGWPWTEALAFAAGSGKTLELVGACDEACVRAAMPIVVLREILSWEGTGIPVPEAVSGPPRMCRVLPPQRLTDRQTG